MKSLILHNKCDGMKNPIYFNEKCLKEFVWDRHLVSPDSPIFINSDNWSADDINIAISFSQFSCLLLQSKPIAAIELVILWTDIRQIKPLPHRFLGPFHVSCWSHMPLVPSRI